MVIEIALGIVSGLLVGGTLILSLYNIFDKKSNESENIYQPSYIYYPVDDSHLAE